MSELPRELPLFPLPGVTAFPGVPLPLHVFEPRYRTLVENALDSHSAIGMVLLRPGFEASYEGRPPIFPVGCAGKIVAWVKRPDGRYDIRLEGLGRFRVLSERHDQPYRIATIQELPDSNQESPELGSARKRLMMAIGRAPDGPTVLVLQAEVPDAVLVNALCQALPLDSVERESLLETGDLVERCERLIGLLEWKTLEARHSHGVNKAVH